MEAQSHERIWSETQCRIWLKELRDASIISRSLLFADAEIETQRGTGKSPIPPTLCPAPGLKREPRKFPVTSLPVFGAAVLGAACLQFTKYDSVLAPVVQPEPVASAGLSPPTLGLSNGMRVRNSGSYRVPEPSWPRASAELGDGRRLSTALRKDGS